MIFTVAALGRACIGSHCNLTPTLPELVPQVLYPWRL